MSSKVSINSINILTIAFLLLSLSIDFTKSSETYDIELDVPDELDNEVALFGDIVEIEDIDPELSELYVNYIMRRAMVGIKSSESQAEIYEALKINTDLKIPNQNFLSQLMNSKVHEENHMKYFIRTRTLGN